MATPAPELLPLEGSKSSVWSYFCFPAQDGGRIIQEKKKTETLAKRS